MRFRIKILQVLIITSACIVVASLAFAQLAKVPAQPQGYVNDYANLMSLGDRSRIVQFAKELDKKTTAQIAVATVKSTQPEDIHTYSVRLFDKWKIGKSGKDNGVLIVVAVNDRKAWITTGYGLEGALPDVTCSRIVQDIMIPHFRNGQYSQGIMAGTTAVVSLIAKEYNVAITGQEAQVYKMVHKKPSLLGQIFYILFLLLFVFGRIGIIPFLLFSSTGHRRRGYWYGSGIGGSSGGFGGGFGGFGGGMTGGGGGGGGW